jgi:hypothetical protein
MWLDSFTYSQCHTTWRGYSWGRQSSEIKKSSHVFQQSELKMEDNKSWYHHPSLPLYLLTADSINKTCIKVCVSWAGLINSRHKLSPNSPNIYDLLSSIFNSLCWKTCELFFISDDCPSSYTFARLLYVNLFENHLYN